MLKLLRNSRVPRTHLPRCSRLWYISRPYSTPTASADTSIADPRTFQLHPSLIKRARLLSEELTALQEKISGGSSFSVSDQKRFSELSIITDTYTKYQDHLTNFQELQELFHDEQEPELKNEAEKELRELQPELTAVASDLKAKLLPPHPFDSMACILELRPGVGGDEAAIFSKDMLEMYSQFAHVKKWPYHIMSQVRTENNGITSATISIDEPGSYKLMKFERGIHRVQRIPETETKGRTHTSTAAVVVLPKISEDNENPDADQREFKPEEIRVDVMRSRGKGGQHVNTTDSAVRITHFPSGIVVAMQDERSQHRNKAKAFAILRARLAERERAEKVENERKMRTSQVSSTDRSDKIRTYNFTQNRITDHRCGFSLHDVGGCMNGTRLEEIILAVEKNYNEERSKELLEIEENSDKK
ncbi:Mrf1 protein [Saccharomycopsis crataegensis]|uniref:Peptide chain release factor 1, mitochondrial n=1 Tax=Saccharomycopsis crataegensis TaxID=43959 RepID=A0AAV5QPP2_9ASCO|nr:Mrf1 protein [Saccharomycopsis crataegensis]